jgi:hypothetical protein
MDHILSLYPIQCHSQSLTEKVTKQKHENDTKGRTDKRIKNFLIDLYYSMIFLMIKFPSYYIVFRNYF